MAWFSDRLGAARAAALAALAATVLAAPGARAVEALDGRVQLHGFYEMQIRALDEKFQEELDLAQWYNVLNLEFEFDVLPDGWGPISLMSAYVRVEGRYDAIYSEGFGFFPSINTFGDDAERLPERLRDAKDLDVAGTVLGTGTDTTGIVEPRIADQAPAPFAPPGERRGFPGFDTLFRQRGGDDILGTADDPARYVHERILDFRFAFKDFRGPVSTSGSTQILGPWLPKNFIVNVALTRDRANPFRGRVAATAQPSGFFPFLGGGVFNDPSGIRFFEGDPTIPMGFEGPIDPVDPSSQLGTALTAPDTVLTQASRDACERNNRATCVKGDTFVDQVANGGDGDPFIVRALNEFIATPTPGDLSTGQALQGGTVLAFGGDFSGIVPCLDPAQNDLADPQRNGTQENDRCIPGSFQSTTSGGMTTFGSRVTSPQNIQFVGGQGETPFRPAPDLSNQDPSNPGLLRAQGLYYPSRGLRNLLQSGDLDSIPFNFDETQRAFNRGASQQRTKELKEAYVDVEFLESRLWLRLGLQNIVWGKTELFRTTDQFNPQDLALASLPSLEESRIALWSARAVYSLYNVGPLQDVRLEIAANIDKFEPADLGACGEPFTPDIVCTLTNGIVAHSFLGVGVAGIDRPESPWKEPSDLEIGGRIEWRWDRFSFALTDFYGFQDTPFPDAIFFYERAVDPDSGRPVVSRLPGQSLGTCANGGQIAPDPANKTANTPGIQYSTSFASHPYSVTTGQTPIATAGPGLTLDTLPDGSPLDGSTAVRGGIGSDPDCLRPGGEPGFANAFRLDPEAVVAQTNALQFQASNQQLFAWACSNTVGIAASLDPGACAWTIFTSGELLTDVGMNTPPFVEAFLPAFAGNPDSLTSQNFLNIAHFRQKGEALAGQLVALPLASINRLFNDPQDPFDTNANGAMDNGAGCADDDPLTPCDLGGFDGFDTRVGRAGFPDTPTLDNSLTNEQRALLGCGPFFGTRCDTSVRETQTAAFPQSGPFGGIDFLNMEASALLQSWLGVDGTQAGQIAIDNSPQPGTIGPLGEERTPLGGGAFSRTNEGFLGGPVCTRFVESRGLVKLPGCRGIDSLTVTYDAAEDPTGVQVSFEEGYLPSVDGCVLGHQIRRSNGDVVPVTAVGASPQLARELALCSQATSRRAVPEQVITGFDANGNPIKAANGDCSGAVRGSTVFVNGASRRVFLCRSELVTLEELPLIHPVAGCVESPTNPTGLDFCFEWMNRDLVDEFFAGTAQMFQSELAAFSHNFMMFLVITSCDARTRDLDGNDHRRILPNGSVQTTFAEDPECFNASTPFQPGRCSFSSPQFCTNVKGFFGAAGVRRNTVEAAGNGRFGRRTFIWHSGGEVVLRYDQRNVLGLSMDFAEDVTKTNWGVEFTWIEGIPFADQDSPVGVSDSDAINLTVSVDRPTFINFLNPNRTFFINSQWFFSYLPDHRDSFTFNGPVNVLFTFAVFTGYFQDRVNPQFVTVYDFNSQSGGLLPSLQYRFTEAFSVTVGLMYFFGRTELVDMPVQEFGPASNRAGPKAYEQGVDNLLSLIRKRDEVFLRLRWTF